MLDALQANMAPGRRPAGRLVLLAGAVTGLVAAVLGAAAGLALGLSALGSIAIFAVLLVSAGITLEVMRERDGLRLRVASLEQLRDDRARDARAVVHDLRAPMTTVGAYLELLADGAFGSLTPQARDAARRAAIASGRTRALVEAALLAEVEEQVVRPLERTSADLGLALAEALAALDATIRSSGARVELRGALGRVRAEHDALFRVFANLIDNAVKYARPGVAPLVAVEAIRDGASLIVTVRDYGIGMSSEERAVAFEEGSRGAHATALASGEGLGLATVRRLVAACGGDVAFDEGVQDGTAVRLTFPTA